LVTKNEIKTKGETLGLYSNFTAQGNQMHIIQNGSIINAF